MNPYCQHSFNNVKDSFSAIVHPVPKVAFLGFRLSPNLKKQLEAIAEKEERSMSQVCEVLLRGGVAAYKAEGSKYLQKFLSRQKNEATEE
jgi:hypothetical protein